MTDERNMGIEDDTPLAAEYGLGLLSAQERRDLELRIEREPALAAEVEFWEQRLGVLASEVKSVAPPRQVWARIDAAVGGRDRTASHGGIWNSLAFWRYAPIGSAAIAAASLAALAYVGRSLPSDQPLIAKLDVGGGQAGFVAAIDTGHTGLTIIPASVTDLNQRVLELWLIAPGDKPRSFGLIDPTRPIHIKLPSDLVQRVAADATLAVSLEPPGGSPTALPTGPVIANGKLTNL